MKYRGAFSIGNVCEGTIQCTYATIYDASGKGLFSLQKNKTQYAYSYKSTGGAIVQKLGDNIFFDARQGDVGAGRDTDMRGGITINLPLVYITEISDDTLVPAYLTDDAVEVISKALEKMKVYRYSIYRVAKMTTTEQEKGSKKLVGVQYYAPNIEALNNNLTDHRYQYEVETEYIVSPKYQQLLDTISRREMIYVKPAAFDWKPINGYNATVKGADGKEIKLSDALAAAEKKVARAKALLAMAGASIIL